MLKVFEDMKCDINIALAWVVSAHNALANNSGFSPNQLVQSSSDYPAGPILRHFCQMPKYPAHSGKSVTFRIKYPTTQNVPDEFQHIHLNCLRVAAAILKAQRSPPLAAANRNIHQNKNIRALFTPALCLVSAPRSSCCFRLPSYFCPSDVFVMAPTPPSSQEKRKRNVLTLPKKIELVKRMEKGESRTKLMAEYGIGFSTLYNPKKQKDKLISFVASTEGLTRKVEKWKTLKGPQMQDLDRTLYLWFQARRSEGKAVSGPALVDEAKMLKDGLGIEGCSFSVGCLCNFKQKHGIRKLKMQGERQSADHDAAENFSEEFRHLIREHVSPEQVYNADESALFWSFLPTSTLSAYTEREATGFKVNTDRVMLLPCANAAGTHKCKLFVIGAYKKPRTFKNLVHPPVHYNASESAWMTAALFKWWFYHCFVPEVKEHLHQQ